MPDSQGPLPSAASGHSAASSIFAPARRELCDEIARGHAGRTALARYTERFDVLVRQLFAAAPPPRQPVAVVAVGGYGRRQLCLYSDIDLLVLFGGRIAEAEERFLRGLLHPLWDLGLVVGHHVRDIEDFERLDVDNPEFLLALVDARPIDGSLALFEWFAAAFHTPAAHAHVVDALATLVDGRHARFNSTLYQLEPDVKDAPGALRDVMAARTIAALTDPALLWQGPEDPARLDEAEDFLLRIRSVLHLDAQRNHNVLTHALQERAADLLGYPGPRPQERVERLMGDYFRHARIVTRSLAWARRAAPVPVGANLGRTRDGIRFIDVRQAAVQPATWVGAFQAAIDANCAVSDDALACIRQHAGRFTIDDFLPTSAHRAALVRFLKPRAGLYARLSEMHDCGLLVCLFPPLKHITSRVVRDFYHKYTVDEHTLLAIRTVERLAVRAPGDRERFVSLLQDLEAPELLVLSLLLHDVGKGSGGDHAMESARMSRGTLVQVGLEPGAQELVEFLIANHLVMSQIAFRRDTEDPEIVRQFASLIAVEQRLKLMCLMTVADIDAIGPDTLTPWRAELLWRLYIDTYNHLTLGYGDDLIEGNPSGISELIANRPRDVPGAEIARFLEGLPRRYLQLFDPEAIYRHVRLSRDIHPDELHLALGQKRSAWEMTVVTLDKPFLFSNICGVLSSFGMDILRGHAMTNPNGLVLDVFQFTDRERFLELNGDAREQIFRLLEEVVSGRTSVTERLRGREQSLVHRRPARVVPVVHCDNDSSKRFTILDITADDAFGLLYRISRTISQHGCDVDLVLIATEGHKAIDVFHITKAGAKLSEPEHVALATHLQRTLEGSHEVDQEHHPAAQG